MKKARMKMISTKRMSSISKMLSECRCSATVDLSPDLMEALDSTNLTSSAKLCQP